MFVFATTSIFREAQRPIAIDGHAHQLGRHPNGIGTSISMSMSMSISMYINIGISMGTLSRQRQLPRPDKRPTQRPHRQGNVIPIQSLCVRHVLDVGIRSPQIAEVVEAEEDQLRFGRDAVAHGVGVDGVVLNVVEDVFVVMVVVVVVVVVVPPRKIHKGGRNTLRWRDRDTWVWMRGNRRRRGRTRRKGEVAHRGFLRRERC
mmetsp:Transcript_25636/g.51783  ORF Transcript_25636/g.51783 Transcript_25636/m.51783 type:complete len:203 (-) Transcript_25636:232-840(-)